MKRTIVKNTAAALLAFSLSAPLWAAKPPVWVNGPDPKYPDSTYIVGVGIGQDLDEARSSARAEISRVFRASVRQTLSDTQTESSSSVGRKRGTAHGTQQSEMNTQVMTESLLEGVQITETWYDKKNKKDYALAVLNKPETRKALSFQMTDKEEAIQGRLAQAKAARSPIDQAKAYAHALRLSLEKDEIATRLRVVDPSGMADMSAGLSSPQIEKSLNDSLGRIQIILDTDGGPDSRLKEAVSSKVTEMGFKISDAAAPSTGENPVLKIKSRLTVQPFDRGNPSWKFFRWDGSFEMSEAGPDGKVLVSSSPSGSEGHMSESTALTRTRVAGEAALAEEAKLKISQYIFGDN